MICSTEYNLKRNSSLYAVDSSETNKYKLDIYPDLTFSQTFDENSYKRKTLHAQNDLHEGSTLVSANPANFSFTMPIYDKLTTPFVILLASIYTNGSVDYMDLYFVSDNVAFKIQKSVIETLVFNTERSSILTMTVSGTAAKIEEFVYTDISDIPGNLVDIAPYEYSGAPRIDIDIDGTTIDRLGNFSLEIANEVSWVPFKVINNTLNGNISYPVNYIVKSRRVSGSVTEFLTNTNSSNLYNTSNNASIDITIGTKEVADFIGITLPSAVFTRRVGIGEILTRTYDFRLNTNISITVPSYKGGTSPVLYDGMPLEYDAINLVWVP